MPRLDFQSLADASRNQELPANSGGRGDGNSFFTLPPEPEQSGVAANKQIRQYDFHGRVCDLRRNV